MLKHRLYYTIKPYLPWEIRMAVRRFSVRGRRKAHRSVWPILESAGRTPPGWKGWPGGKSFALVLTHDVEGAHGLAKCQRLAEQELRLGYRSSFNLIPEGSYVVRPALRQWLTQQGFEVGVHDLQHDGKLFRSRRSFEEKAQKINRHLKNWGAVGFRSGFMLRNLDWLHQLEIEYDSSTFDTDPFELQPDGAGTIFPFWISLPAEARSSGARSVDARVNGGDKPRGYVELPYTLPQDSTLFLLLQESSPEIWMRKLDWIAQHGGMALVNVHPDYLRFDGEAKSPKTSPIAFYTDFLKYVHERYAGAYWNALPREVAAHVHPRATCGVQ
jgi:hypothetical protein